jgi:flotillin
MDGINAITSQGGSTMLALGSMAVPQLETITTGATIWLGLAGAVTLLLVFFVTLVVKQYKRCPSNKILVIYGKVGSNRAAQCLHGGGKFVVPLIQSHAFLGLDPLVIEIPLEGALSLNNIRVNVPATFTVGISTDPVLMNNAAERLLNLDERKIRDQAQDIILGQLRLVIATLSIEEINKDREKFMSLINANVAEEINKIGLELINVNIRDITDESGYIEAIGKRAAAEAINRARVEVAEQDRDGAMGQAAADRQKDVGVAEEAAQTATGRKRAEQQERVEVAALEAASVKGEVESKRDLEIATAQRDAETVVAAKQAEQTRRIDVSRAEASAVEGENQANAEIAESNARLAEVRAEADRRARVAAAEAARAVLVAEREQELARLNKEEIAKQEIERTRVEIEADAVAERARREAAGRADAILATYAAEAEGTRKVLEAKAAGYQRLMEACAADPSLAPTLLMIEQLPAIIAEQVKAIQNLHIDKITVWDSGQARDGSGATADFLAGLIGALPPVHELAQQAGIELPSALGRLGNQASNGEGRPVQAKAMAEPEAVATPRLEEEPPGQAEGPIG